MGVKFTKCQAHIIFFDGEVGWKKRLDKIHISMRNALTVKITQMFIFDSQPFFFKYIYSPLQGSIWSDHHCILIYGQWTLKHTNIWRMKHFQTERKTKTCFPPNPSVWAKIFPTVPSIHWSLQWVPRASLGEAKSLCRSCQDPDFDILEHIWHSCWFRGWENNQADSACM